MFARKYNFYKTIKKLDLLFLKDTCQALFYPLLLKTRLG